MGRPNRAQGSEPERQLTVAQVVRRGAAKYSQAHRGGAATAHVQGVLAKLALCRTAELGGRWYQCDDCQHITKLYNSCGDRHCSACSGSKRYDWSERAEKLLIDGVEYYQVVFTLPEDLSTLALANRGAMADLLFKSAWKSLSSTIRLEQGYEPASLMVLHTWNQKLDAHWHVHALVPAGGPSVSDGSWKTATSTHDDDTQDNNEGPSRKYLVDAINLRHSFRKYALSHLKRLHRDGKLQFGGTLEYLTSDDHWKTFVQELGDVEWVSHITPPQSETSRAENIVRYLTRYLTGGPISDHRILAANDESVTFLAREGRVTGGECQQVPYTLTRDEFVRRWCLHIQSDQLTKTRYFGGWSNTLRKAYLDRCHEALAIAGLCTSHSTQDPVESKPQSLAESAPLKCEHCSSESLTLIKELPKPGWKAIFCRDSTSLPQWYSDWQRADDREFWDGRMGEGFSDFYEWHLKTQAESAKHPGKPSAQRPLHQLCLPGMDSTGTYDAISL